MEQLLFDWVIEERHHRRRVTCKSIKRVAGKLFRDLYPAGDFRASSGWCNKFMTRFNLRTRLKTHQSQKTPEDLIPKLIDFQLYLRAYYRDHPSMELSDIIGLSKAGLFFNGNLLLRASFPLIFIICQLQPKLELIVSGGLTPFLCGQEQPFLAD